MGGGEKGAVLVQARCQVAERQNGESDCRLYLLYLLPSSEFYLCPFSKENLMNRYICSLRFDRLGVGGRDGILLPGNT